MSDLWGTDNGTNAEPVQVYGALCSCGLLEQKCNETLILGGVEGGELCISGLTGLLLQDLCHGFGNKFWGWGRIKRLGLLFYHGDDFGNAPVEVQMSWGCSLTLKELSGVYAVKVGQFEEAFGADGFGLMFQPPDLHTADPQSLCSLIHAQTRAFPRDPDPVKEMVCCIVMF